MTPAAITGPVMAMARPGRPATERALVRAAVADGVGTMAQRARRLAVAVARQALDQVDGDPAGLVLQLLGTLAASPAMILATDPNIDTAALIRAERSRQLEARGGRRAPESEWATEDSELIERVADTLARRYQRQLCRFCV